MRIPTSKQDKGFTLIELLVVIVIIGILAAIAIPVFLNQREKAAESAVKSDLKNAATVMETYFIDTQDYGDVTTAEFELSDDVDIAITSATTTEFCLDGTHDGYGDIEWSYDSAAGGLTEGACV